MRDIHPVHTLGEAYMGDIHPVHTLREAYMGGIHPVHTLLREAYRRHTPCTYTLREAYREEYPGIHLSGPLLGRNTRVYTSRDPRMRDHEAHTGLSPPVGMRDVHNEARLLPWVCDSLYTMRRVSSRGYGTYVHNEARLFPWV